MFFDQRLAVALLIDIMCGVLQQYLYRSFHKSDVVGIEIALQCMIALHLSGRELTRTIEADMIDRFHILVIAQTLGRRQELHQSALRYIATYSLAFGGNHTIGIAQYGHPQNVAQALGHGVIIIAPV